MSIPKIRGQLIAPTVIHLGIPISCVAHDITEVGLGTLVSGGHSPRRGGSYNIQDPPGGDIEACPAFVLEMMSRNTGCDSNPLL